jgi:hypothetical protein
MKLKIIITLICLFLLTAGCNKELMWLKVIDKQIYPKWVGGISNKKYGIVMESEEHKIIITYDVELFYLVNINDIINANVEYYDTNNDTKEYKISNIEFLNEKGIFDKIKEEK